MYMKSEALFWHEAKHVTVLVLLEQHSIFLLLRADHILYDAGDLCLQSNKNNGLEIEYSFKGPIEMLVQTGPTMFTRGYGGVIIFHYNA